MPEPTLVRAAGRTAARASRLARRKGRAARVATKRAVRGARQLPGVVDASTVTRQRNRDVLSALVAPQLCGLGEREINPHRSLSLLRARATALHEGTGLESRLVQAGLLPWTARHLGLRASAEAAAAEALNAGNLALAGWLATSVLRSARSAVAVEIQRVLAVHGQDWEAAHVWRRRQLKVPAGEPSPKAEAWIARERRRLHTQRLYRLFLDDSGGPSPAARRDVGGDAAHFWSRAVAATDRAEALRLGAQAVIEAHRGGRETHQGARRYEESFLAGRIATHPDGLDRYLPLFHAFALPARATTLAPVEVASSVRVMNVRAFRAYVAGKSICLVANSPSLIGSRCGEVIDAYDLVMRFNSFKLDPEHTGARTDIHVTIHMHDYNWDVPVPVRIVLSGDPDLWIESVRQRVRPGAQEWLGDDSLRWPARDLGLITRRDPYRVPTAGFNLLRLLLHLDVSSAVDLIGFDFYESGKLRLEEAMNIPHSSAHNSGSEREWVMAHAHHVTPTVISMLSARATESA